MASITKSSTGGYRVQWREGGSRKQRRFKTAAEAKKFAAYLELSPIQKRSTIKVADLIDEYRNKETVEKRGSREEYFRMGRLMQRPFAQKTLSEITSIDIEDYLKERRKEPSCKYNRTISSTTLIRELSSLSVVFSYAIRRGLMEKNPVANVRRPKPEPHRERVATDEDIEKLMVVAQWDGKSPIVTETQLVLCLFLLACRTGMRSGEMLQIKRSWIEDCVIHLPREATKTAQRRDVALCTEARAYLDLILALGYEPRIVGDLTDAQRDGLWRKLRDRAGLYAEQDCDGIVLNEGLNFHDSRATFATWAASPDPKTGVPRLDVLALARQTGHTDLKMLQRYYRATARDVARRLG